MKNIEDEFSVQIPNNDRVKAFSAAIHLLHKVGKDMTIGLFHTMQRYVYFRLFEYYF